MFDGGLRPAVSVPLSSFEGGSALPIDDLASSLKKREDASYGDRTNQLTVGRLYLPSANDREIIGRADELRGERAAKSAQKAIDFVAWREKDLVERYAASMGRYRAFYGKVLAWLKGKDLLSEFLQTYLTAGEARLVFDCLVKGVDLTKVNPEAYAIDYQCSRLVTICTVLDLFQDSLRHFRHHLFDETGSPTPPDNGLSTVILATRIELESNGVFGNDRLVSHLYARRCSKGSNGGMCPNQAVQGSWYCNGHNDKKEPEEIPVSVQSVHPAIHNLDDFLEHLASCSECLAYYKSMTPPDHLRCEWRLPRGKRCPEHHLLGGKFCQTHEDEEKANDRAAKRSLARQCTHVFPSGRKCRNKKKWGSKFCDIHQPEELPPDEERCTRMFGPDKRCKNKRVPGTDRCETHPRKVEEEPPPDEERCTRMFGQGKRCKNKRVPGTDRCETHPWPSKEARVPKEPPPDEDRCTRIKKTGEQCINRRKPGYDLCAGCLTLSRGGPPPDNERCIGRKTRGRCAERREEGSNYCSSCNPNK